jgi:hypothetical protein
MTGLHYPDNLYADHEERKARRSQQPTGACDGRGAGSPPSKPGHGYVIDPVTKPAHYQRAGIETIDYIRATLDGPGFEAYCIGNVLKYVSRYREKGGIEDLRKAQVYLGWAINPKPANAAAMREAKIAYDMASDKPERVPKWDVRWGIPVTERKGYSQGSHAGTTGPIPQNAHPMAAETIRDHDERLAGGEDRL